MAKIVLAGGGTAGHIIPNLALVSELRKYFDDIYYLGGDGMEKEIVPKYGLPFFSTTTVKLNRKNICKNLAMPFTLKKSINEAKDILERIQPDVVFAKGGYASLPACFAAKSLKIPVVIHESDLSMGLANKLVASFAKSVLTAFAETPGGIYTGNPLREELFNGDAMKAIRKYEIDTAKPVVLIFGGSSGSKAINDAVYQALPKLTNKFSIVHISGKCGNTTIKVPRYRQIEYADDIFDLFALAAIVVSRAGANALAELTALGKKVLAIPLPKGASRGDQVENALCYQKKGLIAVLPQDKLTPETLVGNIEGLYYAGKVKPAEKRNTNEIIVREILKAMK